MTDTTTERSGPQPAVGAPVERPVRPWGTRLDLDAQPVGYDRRQGDILRWRELQVGPLYDQAALDAVKAAERERCAKLCEDYAKRGGLTTHEEVTAKRLADILRA